MARDGAEAMDRVAEAVPDLIVLDAMMPAPDGFEVLRLIKEDKALRHIPVLMLTSRKEEQDIIAALEIGASDYIVKPFNPDELVARLSRLIAQPPR